MKVKTVSQTSDAWKASHSYIPGRYSAGIDATDGWQAAATSEQAKTAYVQGVQDAIARGAREKGLQGVSDGEWKNLAKVKGSANIGVGMRQAVPKYNEKMGKVLNVLAGVSLGPRTSDPSANIDARVKPQAMALHEAKKRGDFQ